MHVILPRNEINIEYILFILNSTMATYYFRYLNPETGEALAEVKKETVAKIPIPSCDNTNIFRLLVGILEESKNNKLFIDFNNALVYELYFPDHTKEREIDIIQFIKNDIVEVMQGKEFETLSDTQKEEVISEFHTRWSDPNSEIVKRINSFAEKSPEILKPILES